MVDDSDNQAGIDTHKRVIDEGKTAAEVNGTTIGLQHMNNASSLYKPIGLYGHEGKRDLHAVGRQYDRERVLQKTVSGGIKLF